MIDGNSPCEVWGGLECTSNRVGDRWHSQLRRSRHPQRVDDDLDAMVGLGLTGFRYPVLWEEVERVDGTRDFRTTDRAIARLQRAGVRPIIGLVHHGSGPPASSLLDAAFPALLADFAAEVASRYPHVTEFTPVNEPLTTARFSGLYGHWYPHHRSDRSFVRALLTEVRGIVEAMRAIRRISPGARLVQTEDLGEAAGTPLTRDQVWFENERRWLTFDLLCGRVDQQHPLHRYLTDTAEVTDDELAWFRNNPCPPDVMGINHYPRSDRWLDERRELFHERHHGGNGAIDYADVGANECPWAVASDPADLLLQAWNRYRIPLALTEVHVPGDDDARIAWWERMERGVREARDAGATVVAMTSWSVLGSFDWDTLCTTPSGPVTYEPGALDVSHGDRRVTAFGIFLRDRAWAAQS